ncbi:hypothetical protein G1H11_09380 [Phytoactinopolyspora alkaliphila]|uniref:Uncharacterized protein n=1 Tax=Phytoactinopolyspora alkaliphila TaxID=1783498 RepID=A0A6N9YKM2_9ACTN|nr:hypothetical protein [Phytoactinopolyspora alkaliphila]NED95524.1 hypothetical protein [Phytoactinopolyspora alkaliphila]
MTSSTANRRFLPTSPFQQVSQAPVEKFSVDDLLTHDRYGVGRVVGLGADNKVHVDFGAGVQTITLPNSKVTRL